MTDSDRHDGPRRATRSRRAGAFSIEGTQIRLRDWRTTDMDDYARWLSPGQCWHELDAPYYPKPSESQVAEIVAGKRKEIEAGDLPIPRTSLVIALRDTDALLGTVTRAWESRETNWPSVGIAIFDPSWWGRGVGYEALGLWSGYLFREMPEVVRLDLRTWSGNRGMMRLAEKLGYTLEARFRKARIVAGQYYDGLGYGVLREEWDDLYPDGIAARLRQSRDP